MAAHSDAHVGRHYRADIDGLRAISIVGVLVFHAFPQYAKGGFVGVDVFFVISGFLIGGLIFSELEEGRFSFLHFYARRVRRIFPALVLVLAVTYLIGWFVLFADEFRQLGKQVAGAAFFVINFVLLGETGYFDNAAITKPLLHLWSLAIEEQFYVVWPLYAALMFRRPALFLKVTIALCAISLLFMIAIDSRTVAFFSPVSRFWELMFGVLLAYGKRRPNALLSDRMRHLAGWIGLALIAIAIFTTPEGYFPGWRTLLPVVGTCLLISSGPEGWLNRQVLALRPMVFVGLISYPLYLWHWPLLSYASIISGGITDPAHGADVHGTGPSAGLRLGLLALSFVLAYLTYEFVERPIRFGRQRDVKAIAVVACMMALGAVGLLTVARDGIASRAVAENNRHLAEDLRLPTATRTSNGSCERLLGIHVEGDAVCLANSDKPTVMIVGDSQAMALHSAIYENIVKLPTVLLAANSFLYEHAACLRDGDIENWLKGSEPCQQVVRASLRAAADIPSIHTVIILFQRDNPFYLDREKIEVMQTAFLEAGKQVVYFLSAPGFWSPAASCQPRKIEVLGFDLSPATTAGNCRQARWTFSEFENDQRRYIAELKGNRRNVFVFDQLPSLCDEQFCYQAGPDGIWFWTLQHVNEKGSRRILKDFLAWARANLQGFAD